MAIENGQIADMLDEIGDLLELVGENAFRVRSYHNASRSIRDLPQRLEDLVREGKDLSSLPNVGKNTASKIQEIVQTGRCQRLEDLKQQVPPELTALMEVPQLGARKAMQIHQSLGVKNLTELKEACEEHRVRELPGMGAKTEENILKGLRTLASASGRILLKQAADRVASIGRRLEAIRSVRRWEAAGSYRRGKETVGDLDLLVLATDREAAAEEILTHEDIEEVIGRGSEKVSVRMKGGLQVDFRFFEEKTFGAALCYFTGSQAHNIRLRGIAQDRGWKLNEYGLFEGRKQLAGKTEASVHNKLGLQWMAPELREDRGEVEAADAGTLPRLVEDGDLRGELHAHTTESDGGASIEGMAEAARARGYAYLAITDHSKAVAMANGLDEERLRRHADRIREINEQYDDLWLLAGIEVDIHRDGTLDLDEKVLADLDWVVASCHYHFNLSEKQMTDRLLAAVHSGVVHCLGHPTTRMVGKRDPLQFDGDRVFEACREKGVAAEVNAQPPRLDLPDTLARRARDAGARLTICTDAHQPADMDLAPFGVQTARRGWVEKKDVLNTTGAKGLASVLGAGSGKRGRRRAARTS